MHSTVIRAFGNLFESGKFIDYINKLLAIHDMSTASRFLTSTVLLIALTGLNLTCVVNRAGKSGKVKGKYSVVRSDVQSTSTNLENNVYGQITDAQSDLPLPHVSISIQGAEVGTTTDDQGNYELTMPTGKHKLIVSSSGYTTLTAELNIRPDELVRMDVKLGYTWIE